MYKLIARSIIFMIAVCVGMIAFMPHADAAENPIPDYCYHDANGSYICEQPPEECVPYVAQVNDYLLAVISNYKADLEYQKTQTDMWHEAHDRVAANAVARNIEYAELMAKYQKLQYKKDYWKQLAQERK